MSETMKTVIPEAAVEAAARALDEAGYGIRNSDELRLILEAAAPLMMKAAYDLGLHHGANQPPNPYRKDAPIA